LAASGFTSLEPVSGSPLDTGYDSPARRKNSLEVYSSSVFLIDELARLQKKVFCKRDHSFSMLISTVFHDCSIFLMVTFLFS
jgi:hypothetical protein